MLTSIAEFALIYGHLYSDILHPQKDIVLRNEIGSRGMANAMKRLKVLFKENPDFMGSLTNRGMKTEDFLALRLVAQMAYYAGTFEAEDKEPDQPWICTDEQFNKSIVSMLYLLLEDQKGKMFVRADMEAEPGKLTPMFAKSDIHPLAQQLTMFYHTCCDQDSELQLFPEGIRDEEINLYHTRRNELVCDGIKAEIKQETVMEQEIKVEQETKQEEPKMKIVENAYTRWDRFCASLKRKVGEVQDWADKTIYEKTVAEYKNHNKNGEVTMGTQIKGRAVQAVKTMFNIVKKVAAYTVKGIEKTLWGLKFVVLGTALMGLYTYTVISEGLSKLFGKKAAVQVS